MPVLRPLTQCPPRLADRTLRAASTSSDPESCERTSPRARAEEGSRDRAGRRGHRKGGVRGQSRSLCSLRLSPEALPCSGPAEEGKDSSCSSAVRTSCGCRGPGRGKPLSCRAPRTPSRSSTLTWPGPGEAKGGSGSARREASRVCSSSSSGRRRPSCSSRHMCSSATSRRPSPRQAPTRHRHSRRCRNTTRLGLGLVGLGSRWRLGQKRPEGRRHRPSVTSWSQGPGEAFPAPSRSRVSQPAPTKPLRPHSSPKPSWPSSQSSRALGVRTGSWDASAAPSASSLLCTKRKSCCCSRSASAEEASLPRELCSRWCSKKIRWPRQPLSPRSRPCTAASSAIGADRGLEKLCSPCSTDGHCSCPVCRANLANRARRPRARRGS
mmetsp:Transcript_2627/g.3583  ORF Transcript_2627/g.3583 Transcript_2627/m.3583 type:complete len:381 (-) Transcript_2627:708-1850(-)